MTGWYSTLFRVRPIEIGEAVKAIDPDLLAREPAITEVVAEQFEPANPPK